MSSGHIGLSAAGEGFDARRPRSSSSKRSSENCSCTDLHLIFSTASPPWSCWCVCHLNTLVPRRGHGHSWLFSARAMLPRKPGLPLHHCNSHSLLWVATSVPNTHTHAFPCVLQCLAHIVMMGVTRLCCDYNRKTSPCPALRPSRQGLFSYPSLCPQHLALCTTDGRQAQQNVQNTDGWMNA